MFAGEKDWLGRLVGQSARMRAEGHEDAPRLYALCRLAGPRVEQMAIALAVAFEVALVIARGADGPAVRQLHRSDGAWLARMLDAHTPRPVAVLADSDDVAADIDQRALDALLAQVARRIVQRPAFGAAFMMRQRSI